MAFWSTQIAEPKRNYRWAVLFGPADLSAIRYALKKVDKPKAKIGEVPHKYLNHTFYYPGRLEWEAINMTLASITEPDATQRIHNVLTNAGYGVPRGTLNEFDSSTIGKNKFRNALGIMSIIQLNADGQRIETWELHNPFFTNVNYGSLDYGSEEIVEISCTVRYDWAQLTTHDPGAESSNSPNFPYNNPV